jgi:hypothetical protein
VPKILDRFGAVPGDLHGASESRQHDMDGLRAHFVIFNYQDSNGFF